jgi:poly(hydroxyalkanoate) granule-associated protein
LALHRAYAQPFSGEIFVAKLKKTARTKSAAAAGNGAELQARAEHLSRSLVESAQQIWMAGVGAFNRAQGEGSKLFEALVNEGMNIEKHTRKLATGRVDAVRDAVEDRVAGARARATDGWDRLEKVFEERVQRALNKLGIPGREEVVGLNARIDALTAQLRNNGGKPAASARPAVKKAAPAKKPARKAAKSAKPRKAARKSLPRAARPLAPRA